MITVTEKALNQIKKLLANSSEPESYLRISILGGGCSGMSYKMSFEPKSTPLKSIDKLIAISGVQLVVDSKSALYLKGTELDFSDGLDGQGFSFNNPNAKRSCGCGSSFSV